MLKKFYEIGHRGRSQIFLLEYTYLLLFCKLDLFRVMTEKIFFHSEIVQLKERMSKCAPKSFMRTIVSANIKIFLSYTMVRQKAGAFVRNEIVVLFQYL
jgi:hypothetical protein